MINQLRTIYTHFANVVGWVILWLAGYVFVTNVLRTCRLLNEPTGQRSLTAVERRWALLLLLVFVGNSRGRRGGVDSTSIPALRGLADLRHVRLGEGITLVGEHADTARGGNEFADQLHTLAGHLRAPARLSGDVAARPGEARDEASRDRIARLPSRSECRASPVSPPTPSACDDEVDLEADQLGGLFQLEIGPAGSRAYLQAKKVFQDAQKRLSKSVH
jgi:hypothetical protein